MQTEISSINTEIFLLSTAIILFLSFGLILFIVYYQKSRLQFRREKEIQEHHYERKILKNQLLDKEQTLSKVARDMHDNVANKASLLNMKIARLVKINQNDIADQLSEVSELTAELITEIKAVSHSLNTDRIHQISLHEALAEELKRIENLGYKTDLSITGDQFTLQNERKTLLFRICQEALGNTRRHANANTVSISLTYTAHSLTIILKDNGTGFDIDRVNAKNSTGLLNMESNTKLLGGTIQIESNQESGTAITVKINRNESN